MARGIYRRDPQPLQRLPKLTPDAVATGTLKTANGLVRASIKTINGLAIASVKTYNGLTP